MTNIENKIEELVKTAMKTDLTKDTGNWPFVDIEDYQKKSGKRFRITRAQRESGISRQEAFREFMERMIQKP